MVDSEEYERWKEEAHRALDGARAQRQAAIFNWSCFLAEQSAKLAVKAVLHGIGSAPWGPDLVLLDSMLREAVGQAWGETLASPARRLSRHYIPARYPDAHPRGTPGGHYGSDDADAAIDDAEGILESAATLWEGLKGEADKQS